MPDDARWTMMGYADQLARRVTPGARRRPRRARLVLGLLWLLCVTCLGASLAMVGLVSASRAGQQILLDTLATIGLGTPAEGASVAAVRCSYHRRTGRYALSEHQCDVTVIDRGVRHRMDVRSTGALTPAEARRVVRIGAAPAVAWPAGVMASRWVQMSPLSLGLALLLPLAWYSGREIARTHRIMAAIRSGEPREAVLLRRHASRKRSDAGVWWEFAYDHDGARRFGRTLLQADPMILDGVATRGIALVTPDGEAVLMRGDGGPLAFAADDRAWIADMTHALRHAHRRAAPGLDDAAARLAPGPERDVVSAFEAAWRAVDAAALDAAIKRRHDAAAALPLETVDRLLDLCRAALRAPAGRAIPAGG